MDERGESQPSSPPRFCLRGTLTGRPETFRLEAGENHVGSLRSNDVVLREPGVSRRHAVIEARGVSLSIRDLESKNGTFVNGRRVSAAKLQPGDEVELGRICLRVDVLEPEEAELAMVLEPGGERPEVSSGAGRDTLHLERLPRPRVETLAWLGWVESLVARLCATQPDPTGALGVLVRELGALAAWWVEQPAGGDVVVLGSSGGSDALPPEGAVEVFAEQARSAAVAEAEARCRSFRCEGRSPLVGAVAVEPPAPPLGLLLIPGLGGSEGVEGVLRTLVRLLLRLRPLQQRPALEVRTAEDPRLVFPRGYVAGSSSAMRGLYAQMAHLLEGDLPVLILGETGVGKEYLARALHLSAKRCRGPFVAVNCAAIPATLLEAELFGVEAGVATGVVGRTGKLVQAEGGTLFLDEVGDMARELQGKLLRVLQEKEVHPVGGRPVRIDLRVISATNADLEARLEAGGFRRDLYYRLAGYVLLVPPLRERCEDVPALVEHFLRRFAADLGKRVRGITVRALRQLTEAPWPGNVRELEHEVRRLVYACTEGQSIDSHLLAERWRPGGGTLALEIPAVDDSDATSAEVASRRDYDLERLERDTIRAALRASGGKLVRAAGLLGISRDSLRRRIERHGLRNHRV